MVTPASATSSPQGGMPGERSLGNDSPSIWMLDDDQEMCSLLAQQSERVGWRFQVFHHPLLLLEALEARQPDLLVLDQLLPEKHGLDVLRRLRLQHPNLPVLILSALAAPSDRVSGLEAGADDYLAKPFQFRELQLRCEHLLRYNRALREAATSQETDSPSPPLLQAGSFQLGPLRFEVGEKQFLLTPDGTSHRLGRGDAALLMAFCRHPRMVLSRTQLLQATGSLVSPGHTRTIDVRLSRLRRLLRNLTGEELILPARGQGYKLIAAVSPIGEDGSIPKA